jgi:hypothetical protein
MGILKQGRPIVSIPKHFVGSGISTKMTTGITRMKFRQHFFKFLFSKQRKKTPSKFFQNNISLIDRKDADLSLSALPFLGSRLQGADPCSK